jgi:hypothetical protein
MLSMMALLLGDSFGQHSAWNADVIGSWVRGS